MIIKFDDYAACGDDLTRDETQGNYQCREKYVLALEAENLALKQDNFALKCENVALKEEKAGVFEDNSRLRNELACRSELENYLGEKFMCRYCHDRFWN